MNLSIVGSDVHIFEVVGQRDGPGARIISLIESPLGSSVNTLKDLRNVDAPFVATATLTRFTEKKSVGFNYGRGEILRLRYLGTTYNHH
jgi:hypothetical protein